MYFLHILAQTLHPIVDSRNIANIAFLIVCLLPPHINWLCGTILFLSQEIEKHPRALYSLTIPFKESLFSFCL